MKKIIIIGFGRFGQLLSSLVKNDFEVSVIDTNKNSEELASKLGFEITSLDEIGNTDIICLTVPISEMEDVILGIKDKVLRNQIVIDFCSVKVYPAQLMKKYLVHAQTLATHPLFGPDSVKGGLTGLKMALCPLNISKDNLKLWSSFWEGKGVEIIMTSPDEHDSQTIYSQAFTYSISHIIQNMSVPELVFTTKNYEAIKKVSESVANDSNQLFHDMLFYNPYFKTMKKQFDIAVMKTSKTLDTVLKEIS